MGQFILCFEEDVIVVDSIFLERKEGGWIIECMGAWMPFQQMLLGCAMRACEYEFVDCGGCGIGYNACIGHLVMHVCGIMGWEDDGWVVCH